MLDAVVDYLPSPLDIPAIKGINPDDRRRRLKDLQMIMNHFQHLAFKIMTDPFVGKLCFFRVYSGKIECRFLCI